MLDRIVNEKRITEESVQPQEEDTYIRRYAQDSQESPKYKELELINSEVGDQNTTTNQTKEIPKERNEDPDESNIVINSPRAREL